MEKNISKDQMECFTKYKDEMKEAIRKNGNIFFLEKSKSGYVGLLNQGATCYLNSLLQTLFFTPEFKDAVNTWAYESSVHGKEENCIPLQLQLLFARLELSDQAAVSTKGLTQSFGWTGTDVFQQHDVQELFSKLMDALEKTAPDQFNEIGRLFTGSMSDCIECKMCGFKREHKTTYRDLQLDLGDCASLEEMLKQFSAHEVLDGDNKCFCTQCDEKAPTEKWLEVTSFPEVACLHLKRFVFDLMTMRRCKLNQPVSLSGNIDMHQFVAKPTQENIGDATEDLSDSDGEMGEGEDVYDLSAILMHSGTAHGGHYRAFIREIVTDKWYEFNDAIVTEISAEEVQQLINTPSQRKPESEPEGKEASATVEKRDPTSDAYMLIYRKSLNIEASVKLFGDPVKVPQVHSEKILSDNDKFQNLRTAYEVHRSMVSLKIFHPAPYQQLQKEDSKSEEVLETTGEPDGRCGPFLLHSLDVHQSTTLNEVLDMVLEYLRCSEGLDSTLLGDTPRERCRLRRFVVYSCRGGETFGGQEQKTLADLGLAPGADLALETIAEGQEFVEFNPEEMSLNLVKWQHPADEGLGEMSKEKDDTVCVVVPGEKKATVESLRHKASESFNVPVEQVLLIKPGASGVDVVLISDDSRQLIRDYHIWPGERIIVELIPTAEDIESYKSKAFQAYQISQSLVHISFNHPDTPTEYDNTVEVLLSKSLSELKAEIASILGLETSKLHLRRSANAPQIKDESKTLRALGLVDQSMVQVGHGAPLKPGEYLVKFMLYEPSSKPQFSPLIEIPVAASMKITDLKEGVFSNLPSKVVSEKSGLTKQHIRLRDKKAKDAGSILRDDRTVGKSLVGFTDGRQIAVQILDNPETVGKDEIVIQIREWKVTDRKITLPTEIVVSKKSDTSHLVSVLTHRCQHLLLGADDSILIAKASSFGPPLNPTAALKLKWSDFKEEGESQISQSPLCLRDGSILVVRSVIDFSNAKEAAQKRAKAKTGNGEKRTKGRFSAARSKGGPTFRPVEYELQIHTEVQDSRCSNQRCDI